MISMMGVDTRYSLAVLVMLACCLGFSWHGRMILGLACSLFCDNTVLATADRMTQLHSNSCRDALRPVVFLWCLIQHR